MSPDPSFQTLDTAPPPRATAPALWRHKARAAGVHMSASAAVVALVTLLVLALWFPGAYRELSGGLQLLLLIAMVDVVMGPLLTFVVFNPAKRRTVLMRDLGLIVAMQCLALAYGTWTLAQARPTHLVFEVDLFRVVTANDIEPGELGQAPAGMQKLPWFGPATIGVRKPEGGADQIEATMRSMAGQPLAAMPRYWVPFESQRAQVQAHAKPLSELTLRDAAARQRLTRALADASLSAEQARWLPLMARRAAWTVLVDGTGQPRGLVAIDG